MVTFGFLTYCDGKISIPNKELKEEFIKKEFKETILLVGISLAKNKKEYTCKIEEYANVSELKSAENEMERENKTKKRKRESILTMNMVMYIKEKEVEQKKPK
ncbi:hypothetical protein LY90DRAFT_504903 [Neocallimastix californiae]|uniref:Uncharacterized protein n=1 Tax=Neocallimastix californiae TaxID=1754190 RepID=A0A1Y2E288_9FUNG|nr:hypothetical protein LY90DRAFT_504903 [Neocallimastix californiae]|eukprot:ORY65567.1 hypothetical protein LY90DRAFT_504903 [Neocallimastix californiae]